jgi:tetratricopeptide (TPR) repeat protein
VLVESGRPEEALRCYDAAIRIAPGYAGAWNNRGAVLHAMGRDAEASQCLGRALALDPRNARGWYNRALVERSWGTGEDERIALRRFVELAGEGCDARLDDARRRLEDLEDA